MRKCNFCSSNSKGDKLLLKLKPGMLRQLGVKAEADFYACEDHFDSEAITGGKRRRWALGAKLNVSTSDLELDQDALAGLSADHQYSRTTSVEQEEDVSQEAVSLGMGEEFFTDSQSITCREETLIDEENSDIAADDYSEVNMKY